MLHFGYDGCGNDLCRREFNSLIANCISTLANKEKYISVDRRENTKFDTHLDCCNHSIYK